MMIDELPAEADALFLIRLDGQDFGIGTPREIREMVADGILPADIDLTPAR